MEKRPTDRPAGAAAMLARLRALEAPLVTVGGGHDATAATEDPLPATWQMNREAFAEYESRQLGAGSSDGDPEVRTQTLDLCGLGAEASESQGFVLEAGSIATLCAMVQKGPYFTILPSLAADELASRDWSLDDLRAEKAELARVDLELCRALDKSDGQIFRRRFPQLFG